MFERKSSRKDSRHSPPSESAARANSTAGQASDQGANAAAGAGETAAALKNTGATGARAMIGSKVKVSGDIVSSEDLLVEGEVTGTITLPDNELVIGTSGQVKANISAKTVRIEGRVNGDIEGSERVVICTSGDVEGNVSAPRVMLEDGGRFKGNIDMGSSKGEASRSAGAKSAAASGVHSIDQNVEKAG
jgi:cytoskeletal protein CcmA (bactofilin family)